MTEKRFTINDCKVLSPKQVLKILNQLIDENEQLKTQLQNTSDQRDEFHRGARENANRVGELEKENKELKIKNDLLSDELEQAKAVINKKWSEYLKKKELSE